jgi:hypothetical protein
MVEPKSQWTLDTLAEHLAGKIGDVEIRTKERFDLSKQAIDAALAASEKAINAAMAAAEKAVTKAEVAAEKRFDSVNEFRNAMKDQQSTFADKNQTDFRLGAIEKRLENIGGKSEGVGMSAVVVFQIISSVASLSAVVGVAIVLIRH